MPFLITSFFSCTIVLYQTFVHVVINNKYVRYQYNALYYLTMHIRVDYYTRSRITIFTCFIL